MSSGLNDDYLERVKAEIRAEADLARARTPLSRRDPPAEPQRPHAADGIERERLDYAIAELTGAHYSAFLDGAFRALLKRPPDAAGSAALVRLLAAGASKAEILGNLRWSPEGKRIGTRVHGLLPRYALAKLGRVPVLGYVIDWGIALAGLPILLRHQRAADTATAAGFLAANDTQRSQAERLAAIDADLDTERELRNAEAEAQRDLARRFDELVARSAALETHHAALAAEQAREMIELRHRVLAANHWVVSLQNSLAGLEKAATVERAQADALLAAVGSGADETAARNARHADWAARLGAELGEGASLLDLGSGDGDWLAALGPHLADASGIEANALLVAQARKRGVQVAAGDPFAILARCADTGLDALSLGAGLLTDDATRTCRVLADILRALKPGGHLLLRVENETHRLARNISTDPAGVDAPHWAAVLTAAGFAAVRVVVAPGAAAVFARRPLA